MNEQQLPEDEYGISRLSEFLTALSEIDPRYDPRYEQEIPVLEAEYECEISDYVEKHNALQFTYFYEVDFGVDEMFFVEIESGINNGTVIRSAEWGESTRELTKRIEVLTDIKLIESEYPDPHKRRAAQTLLDANRETLFDLYRKGLYDEYVTGGRSDLKPPPATAELKVEYVFEEQEVDCNFQ